MHTEIQKSLAAVQYPTFSEMLRPRNIDELLIPDASISKLKLMVDSRNVMNMIFYGSAGTGKTTCAKLIGNSESFEMLELNAASTNSIDDIRNQVERYATAMSLYGNTRIVVLDEADYLSNSAQASLRGLIEKTYANCRFILTSNDLRRIQEPLQSRCKPISFNVGFDSLDSAIAKLTKTIISRLNDMNVEIDLPRLNQIVFMKFPDYRAIANDIEFEFL